MRTTRRRVVASALAAITTIAMLASPASADPATSTDSWQNRLDVHREGLLDAVHATQEGMWDRSNTTISSRSLASVVAAELREDRDPVQAWEAMQIILDHQDMDPTSPAYGQFASRIWAGCWYGLECLQLEIPYYTRTTTGSYAEFSQQVDLTEGDHTLSWRQRSDYPYGSAGYHLLQVLVDGEVAWQEQANTFDGTWRSLSVDLDAVLAGKTQATVAVRLYERRPVVQLPVKLSFDTFALSNSDLKGDTSVLGRWQLATAGEGVSVGVRNSSDSEINSTSFTSLMLAGILNSDDIDLLPADQQALLRERARVASWVTADEPHAQLGYTNARLIRDVHMILIGQATGDDELYDLGLANFRDWVAYTKQWGIREYNSPVYYGIDLGALMMGHSYLADEAVREEFTWALDVFWWDMAANYFPGREVLAGSHSRDYDFLRGTGPSAYFLSTEGWQDMPLLAAYTTYNYQVIQAYWGEHIYHPSQQQRTLAFEPYKVVQAKTDPDRDLDRYTYVTPNWALGSTSETFTNVIPGAGGPTPYDKPIAMDLAGDRTTAHISIAPVWNTDPYGLDYPGSAPLHAPLFPTTAQHKGALLTQLDLNPAGQRVPNYSTNVVVPADADLVLLDGAEVDTGTVGEIAATTTSTLLVRVDDACGVIRVLGAEGIDGYVPHAALVMDATGQEHGVARLQITQFASETSTRLTATSAPVGFYLQAADCRTDAAARELAADVAAAPVESGQEGAIRTVSVTTVDGTELSIGTDTIEREPAFRFVNGEQMLAPSILNVNGRDLIDVSPTFAAPTVGTLSSTFGWSGVRDGYFSLMYDLWWGEPAQTVELFRDGDSLGVVTLDPGTDQHTQIDIDGLANGQHTFGCKVRGPGGSAECEPLVVTVTQAAPGALQITDDNWDGDGNLQLTASMWWGTNGTSYRVLQDGQEIAAGPLAPSTPAEQSIAVDLAGLDVGEHTFMVEFANRFGSTSAEHVVLVRE